MNKEEQTEFRDWLNTLPQYLAAADATSHKVPEKVEENPQPANKPSARFSKILGNRQSKTYSVDRLNEILRK